MPGDNIEMDLTLHHDLATEIGTRSVVLRIHITAVLMIGLVSRFVRVAELVSRKLATAMRIF